MPIARAFSSSITQLDPVQRSGLRCSPSGLEVVVPELAGDEWLVVGVAKTAIYYSLAGQPGAHVYFPQLQLYMGRMTFVVATHDEPLAIAGAVEGALREVNPDIAIAFLTMDQLVDEQLANFRVWAVFVPIAT